MAETYGSFQGKEPNIDVNLFVNALTQGIAAGNAQKSTFGAAVAGASAGVSAYQDAALKREQIAQEREQTQVDTAPGVRDARIRKEIAEADKAEAEARELNDACTTFDKKKTAELKRREAEIKLTDMETMSELGDIAKGLATGARTPEEFLATLENGIPSASRNSKEALSLLRSAQPYLDPKAYSSLYDTLNAAEVDNIENAAKKSRVLALQTEAEKKKDMIQQAEAIAATSSPKLAQLMKNPALQGFEGQAYDARKLQILPGTDLELDNGVPKTDINGPVLSKAPNNDPRYFAFYDGKYVDQLPKDAGKELQKNLPYLQLKDEVQFGDTNLTKKVAEPTTQYNAADRSGLASYVKRVDTALEAASPNTPPLNAPPISQEVLAGKTPEQIAGITDTYNRTIEKRASMPSAVRNVVRTVNSDPLLATEPKIVKALASAESGGNPDAVSKTKVQGIMQVTSDTYNEVMDKMIAEYPKAGLDQLDRTSPEASILSGKLYLYTQLKTYNNLPIALAAYSAAGPGTINKALAKLKKDKGIGTTQVDWEILKPYVKDVLFETLDAKTAKDRWNQVEDYPERVLRYEQYY